MGDYGPDLANPLSIWYGGSRLGKEGTACHEKVTLTQTMKRIITVRTNSHG